MNKKVMVISASGRKGKNSDLLCDRFVQGAIDGGNSAQKIRVEELSLNFCLGCRTCKGNGGVCIHKDGMGEVLSKLKEADVIVFATPVYFYGMNGQMKTFIDRTYPCYPEFKGKTFYVLFSGGGALENMDTVLAGFEEYFDLIGDISWGGTIFGRSYPKNLFEDSQHPALQEAYEAGKKI